VNEKTLCSLYGEIYKVSIHGTVYVFKLPNIGEYIRYLNLFAHDQYVAGSYLLSCCILQPKHYSLSDASLQQIIDSILKHYILSNPDSLKTEINRIKSEELQSGVPFELAAVQISNSFGIPYNEVLKMDEHIFIKFLAILEYMTSEEANTSIQPTETNKNSNSLKIIKKSYNELDSDQRKVIEDFKNRKLVSSYLNSLINVKRNTT